MFIPGIAAPNSPDASSSKVTGHEVLQSANSEPSLLSSSPTPSVSPELKRAPDSVSVEPSLLEGQSEKTHETQSSSKGDDAKSTRSTSNKYSNKTKAKVHLGACSIGALTFGILAGPVGLVFAPAYLNAICMATYGGQGFLVGDNNTNQAKPDLDKPESDQPTSSGSQVPPKPTPPNPEESPSNDEEDEDKKDIPPGQFPFNGGNFTFAPVNINYAPNITINGNIYIQQASDQSAAPDDNARKGTTTKDSEQQTDQVIQDNKVSVTNITKMTADQVSRTINTQTSESGVEIAQELMVDGVDAHQVTFSDGAKAIITGLPEAVPSAQQGAISENTQSTLVQPFDKGTESSPIEGDKHSPASGAWIRDGSAWKQTPEGSPAILSPGSAQAISGLHSNRSKGPFHNISEFPHKHSDGAKAIIAGLPEAAPSAQQGAISENAQSTFVQQLGKGSESSPIEGVEADKHSPASGAWIRDGSAWKQAPEGSPVILSPGSAQAISGLHSNRSKGPSHNISEFPHKHSDGAGLPEAAPSAQQGAISENTQSTFVQQLGKGSESSTNEGIEPDKDTANSGVGTNKVSGWEQSSEGSPVILSPGSAQAIPGLHSNRSKGPSHNISEFPHKHSDGAGLPEAAPSAQQGAINENAQSTFVQPLDKGAESSPNEGLEPNKDMANSGVWTRKGSGWEQSSEGSPAILSPGSAQAIPGLHSNRSKGLFNNMEKFTLKKPEKNTPNDKIETRRSLGLVENRVSYPMILEKMVYKNNSASL